jgi:glycosyltransferase involved in cell wall biosynthesis
VHILFLTLAYPVSGNNLYSDMVDELANQGHFVTVCVQDETRSSGQLLISFRRNICILSIPTGKITKTTILTKGINTLLLEYRFLKKLSKFEFTSLDILLYSTPPITFQKVIVKLKKKYNCVNYLLLKDIFPQNAIDLGMIKKNSLLHIFFRYKEKMLYQYSDIIGCMSPGNVKYLIEKNHGINKKINITPNCISPQETVISLDKKAILGIYNIPPESIHLIYGGNIGKPQGIDFIIKCIHIIKNYRNIFLTIVGNGTEFSRLKKSIDKSISNVKLLDSLPKDKYLELLACMDIGLIFLDNRFTIPNFPSRILDYMDYSLPIIACTDIVCDVKQEICDQGAGFWCQSDNIDKFKDILEIVINSKDILIDMRYKSHELLLKKYSIKTVVAYMLHEINNFIIRNKEERVSCV